MKKYHVYHSEEELEFDLDNDNYRYNTLNIYIGEHSFSIEMTADCRRLTTAVKRFSEGYKAAVADGVFPAAIAEFLKSYHIGTLVEDAREMGEPLEYNFYGIGKLNDGTFVNAFELENEVEDSFYIRLTAPYEINGIEKNFPTVYVDCFTASEEPENVTVDDDGSNDEPDEDEEIKATPVSEDTEDEDDDLPDEYWIVKEENEMTTTKATTVITDAELTTKAAVAIDTLLEVRGAVFTNSQRTYSDMAGYLEEIAEYDAGVDQIDVCYEDDEMVDEFRDEYTPDKFVVGFEGRLLTSTFNQLKSKVASFDNPAGDNFVYSRHFAVLKYDAEPVEEEYDGEEYEPETPEPATPQIDSDATIATLGGLLVTALTALYNATTAPAKIVEEPAVESTCYVVRLHGYNAEFPSDPLYSKGDTKFDSLGDAVKYALDDRKARGANEHFGGSIIDKDFDDGNVAGVATVMTILPTGEIETTADEVKRILEKPAGTDEETSVVELKISGVITESNTTFTIQQFTQADSQAGGVIDSEAPATEATIFLQPTSDEAAARDLSDTVLDLKISADEIEELLADGYTLDDSGRASIARAQALMKQALAELAKLKSTDAAA